MQAIVRASESLCNMTPVKDYIELSLSTGEAMLLLHSYIRQAYHDGSHMQPPSGQALYSIGLLHWPALQLHQAQEYVYNSF